MAFMHCHEEGTAHLIRENWQHIIGLHSIPDNTTCPLSSTSTVQSLLSTPPELYPYVYTNIQDYWDVESPRISNSLEVRSAAAASFPSSSSVLSPPPHVRTFFTAIEPNENSPRNPRPNHNSTIADEFTPMLAMNSADCLINSTDSNNITPAEIIVVDLFANSADSLGDIARNAPLQHAKDSNSSTNHRSEDIVVKETDLIPLYRDNIWTHLLLSHL